MIDNINVHIGRMHAEEMRCFFAENSPKIVVDATHPYADKVTENIKNACNCKYIRVTREDDKTNCGMSFDSIKSAVEFLKTTEGEILITTGSKEIGAFRCLCDRAYARVLPTEESISLCHAAGFKDERIIAASPPFTKEENKLLLRKVKMLRKVHNKDLKTRMLLSSIVTALETAIHTARE